MKEVKSNKKQGILILGFIFISLVLFNQYRWLQVDGDTMWHIKVGQWIYEHKTIPKQDVFSWLEGLKWTPHETGYDFFIYLIYKTSGFLGVRLWGLLLCLGSFVLCLKYNNEKIKGYGVSFWILSFLLVSRVMQVSRPTETSTFLILLNILVYTQSTDRKKLYLTFPISSFLMSWLHGGFILTLFIQMFVFLFADIIKWLHTKANKSEQEEYSKLIKDKIFTIFIGILAGMLNPLGYKAYLYYFSMDNTAYEKIAEWQPYQSPDLIVSFLLILSLISLSFGNLKQLEYRDLQKSLTMAFWFMLTLKYCRGANQLYLVLLMLGYEYIQNFISIVCNLLKPAKEIRGYKVLNIILSVFLSISLFVCTISLAYGSIKVVQSYTTKSDKEIYEEIAMPEYSYGCIEYMCEQGITDKYFNAYNTGGYMLFHDLKVFIDSRCDPYLAESSIVDNFRDISRYLDNQDTEQGWIDLSNKYDFDYIVLMPYVDGSASYINILLKSEKFELLYEDVSEVAFLFDTGKEDIEDETNNWYSKGYIFKINK